MKLVVIIGPQAVGKMTVGQELEKITDLKLFHNHMTIELVAPFFEYGSPAGQRLVDLFRKEIFEEVSKSNGRGLIFTYMWDFNEPEDGKYLEELCSIFKSKGFEVDYVELEANREERIKRNKSPHRLRHKPTKRDVDRSERELIDSAERFRLNSHEGEITEPNYLRINNTSISAKKAAKIIKEKFKL